jgi:hypothetical protein
VHNVNRLCWNCYLEILCFLWDNNRNTKIVKTKNSNAHCQEIILNVVGPINTKSIQKYIENIIDFSKDPPKETDPAGHPIHSAIKSNPK